jgi:hypothetical protein
MQIPAFPFQTTDWNNITSVTYNGETGTARWKVMYFGNVRVRMVKYSANYLADHWCNKGHFILCLEGEVTTELKDGRKFTLAAGMTYQVGDESDEHRTSTKDGASIFIVD